MDLSERGRRAADFLKSQPVYWREAALCAPAMPLLVLAGLASGHVRAGVIAAGAAFLVGFGAARNLRGRRWAAMVLAAAGVTLAAFFGCLAGQSTPALLAGSAVISAACAALALLIDEDLWWVSLQVVIAFFVAGFFHGPLTAALMRAEATAAGGVVQILIVIALSKLAPAAADPLPAAPIKETPPRRLLISHMLRAAVCVTASWVVAERLGLANAYWAPMTAMLVLKPGLSETHMRGVARLTGTVAGCLAAALFAFAVGVSPLWLLAGVGFTASAAFALQRAHYALLTLAVTATVVLLLTLAHVGAHVGDVMANAGHRLLATALGGAIALVVARIAPHLPPCAAPAMDQVGEPATR